MCIRDSTEGGALAGSVTNLMDCMKNAVQNMGIPLEEAVAAATINPAKSVGLDDKYGSIKAGKVGNLVLLDQNLELKKDVYKRQELQRDANKRFGFSAKETLNIMQRLYENHKVLTYPRTDSKYCLLYTSRCV